MALRSVRTLVCSNNDTCCINSKGEVLSFGKYSTSYDDCKELPFPLFRIPNLKNIKCVAIGDEHSAFLDNDGNVYTFGDNEVGQLGISEDEDGLEYADIPQKVNLPPCKHVSCGENFVICLTENGVLYSFGNNEEGQLGLGNNEELCYSPQKIESLKDVEFIECHKHGSIFKSFYNEIFVLGCNNEGQFGIGNADTIYTPLEVSKEWPEDIVDIKCGATHTLVLTSNQIVYSCGYNYSGQLGRTSETKSMVLGKIISISEIRRIECGDFHSICIHNEDSIYFW